MGQPVSDQVGHTVPSTTQHHTLGVDPFAGPDFDPEAVHVYASVDWPDPDLSK